MTDFVGRLTAIRKRFAQVRARHWVVRKTADGSYGVLWLTPEGNEMTDADWNFPEGRFLSYVLGPMERDREALYVVLNAAPEPIEFRIPGMEDYKTWSVVLHTSNDEAEGGTHQPNATMQAPPRSVIAFAGRP
jgi:glycogen operon protein